MFTLLKFFEIIFIIITILGIITVMLGFYLDKINFGVASTIYVFLGILMVLSGILSLVAIEKGLFGMIFLIDFSFLLLLVVTIYWKMVKG